MLQAILNKSWRQHPAKRQLYGNLPPITKTIKIRRSRHVAHCWSSRGELVSDVLLWTPSHGRAKAGQPARTYIQQLCADTGCSPEDLPEAMGDREGWRERVRNILADSVTWWWWWWWWFPLKNKLLYSFNTAIFRLSFSLHCFLKFLNESNKWKSEDVATVPDKSDWFLFLEHSST